MYGALQQSLQASRAELAVCGYAYCRENGSIDERRRYERKAPETLAQKETMRRMSDTPPSIRHGVWNKLFFSSLLRGIVFPESLRSSEDVWFLTEYIQRIKTAVIVHEPFYFNRIREGSATPGGLRVRSLADPFPSHYYIYQSIVGAYPDLKGYSQAFLLDAYLLKYNKAKKKAAAVSEGADAEDLKRMRKAIHAEGARALFNREIHWKTRLAYLILFLL